MDPLDHNRTRIPPLVIQGLRTSANDPEAHICFFDVEALIIQLLSDEYSAVSPSTLEAQGLISQTEYCKILGLTHSDSPDAQKKIAGTLLLSIGHVNYCCSFLLLISGSLYAFPP